MSLKYPFYPDFCPVGPSNKHFYKVKFVETVLFALTSAVIAQFRTVELNISWNYLTISRMYIACIVSSEVVTRNETTT